jgi:hypothetical protein
MGDSRPDASGLASVMLGVLGRRTGKKKAKKKGSGQR